MKTAYIAKQRQISFVKSHFSRQLEERLGLIEVQAPILSRVGDGTQDNLSGCEKAVQVKVKALPDAQFEVVHSLAKWKRQTLGQHDFSAGEGLYTRSGRELKQPKLRLAKSLAWHRSCRIRSTSYTARSYCLVIRSSMPKGVSGRLRKILARYSWSGLAAS